MRQHSNWIHDCFHLAFQATISSETQQSRTAGSSYDSICRLPLRKRCSTKLMFRGDTFAAFIWKVYRMNKRNFGWTCLGFAWTIRSALRTAEIRYELGRYGRHTVYRGWGPPSEARTLRSWYDATDLVTVNPLFCCLGIAGPQGLGGGGSGIEHSTTPRRSHPWEYIILYLKLCLF